MAQNKIEMPWNQNHDNMYSGPVPAPPVPKVEDAVHHPGQEITGTIAKIKILGATRGGVIVSAKINPNP